MTINQPETVAQMRAVFARYEEALVTNDVDALDALFWGSEHTIRYGPAESLYGRDEILAFRKARPSQGLDRMLRRTVITTFGDSFATANTEFTRDGSDKVGRQSQTWSKIDGAWVVVAAHVSLRPAQAGEL